MGDLTTVTAGPDQGSLVSVLNAVYVPPGDPNYRPNALYMGSFITVKTTDNPLNPAHEDGIVAGRAVGFRNESGNQFEIDYVQAAASVLDDDHVCSHFLGITLESAPWGDPVRVAVSGITSILQLDGTLKGEIIDGGGGCSIFRPNTWPPGESSLGMIKRDTTFTGGNIIVGSSMAGGIALQSFPAGSADGSKLVYMGSTREYY